jgi:hypothetical protein
MSKQKREDRRARKAQRAANRQQDRRNFGLVAFGGLVMLAVGLGLLWFVAVSIRRGYAHLDDGLGLVHAAEDPVAFWISNVSTAAIGLFSAVMGLQGILHARDEVRGTVKPPTHAGTRRR